MACVVGQLFTYIFLHFSALFSFSYESCVASLVWAAFVLLHHACNYSASFGSKDNIFVCLLSNHSTCVIVNSRL
jgi:hypothetical protein